MTGTNQKKYPCLIWGGYARGNTGDEWCLAAALTHLRHKHGREPAILSPNPEYTSWLFPDTIVVPYVPPKSRSRPSKFLRLLWRHPDPPAQNVKFEWIQSLTESGSLHLASGGYLNDLFETSVVMAPLELALQLGLPVTAAPLGIGPFKSNKAADRIAKALQKVDLKVRDRESLNFCTARGIKAMLEPDDAFDEITRWSVNLPSAATRTVPRKIGVCIFPQYGQDKGVDLTDWWTQSLRGLQARFSDVVIEGFCFHTSPLAEFKEMVRLFRLAGLPVSQVRPPMLDFRAATVALRQYSCIITTRFHAAVAANVFGIPNLAVASGIYYRAKMEAAAINHTALCRWIDPATSKLETVLEFCQSALDNVQA